MSDLNGTHVADGRQYDIEQMCRVASGSVTILDFLLANSDLKPFGHNGIMYADGENCYWYGVLRYGRASQGIPASNRIIHIRQYVPDWRLFCLNMDGGDPLQWTVSEAGVRRWAQHCVSQLTDWHGTGEHHQLQADIFLDPKVVISGFNEMDIEPAYQPYMATKEWYDKIGRIALIWKSEIDRRRPDRLCLLMTPPLAGGHEPDPRYPDGEYQLPAMRDMLQAFDVIGAHCYGQLNNNPAWGMFGSEAKWYGLRLWRGLTEFNAPDTDLSLKNDDDPGGLIYQATKLNKPIHICEAGTFRHADKGYVAENWRHMRRFLEVAAACKIVTGVDWFIWNSNSEHSGNRIWDSPGLRDALEHAPRYLAAKWPTVGASVPLPLPTTTPAPTTTRPPLPVPTTTPAPVPPITTTQPPPIPPVVPVADPNPFGTVLFPGGAIWKELVKAGAVALTGECRAKGDFAQIVLTVGQDAVTGKRCLVAAWQDPAVDEGKWNSMVVAREG